MSWLPLILLSSLVSAGNSVLDKRLMRSPKLHPFACAASFGVVGALVALGGMVIGRVRFQPIAGLAVLAGAVFIGAAWLYYDTVAREDISRLVPLMRLQAVQSLLGGSLFLGDRLELRQQIAFGVILLSSALLGMKQGANGRPALNWSALRVLPVTTLLAITALLEAAVYRATSVWYGIVWVNLGMAAAVAASGAVMLAFRMRRRARRSSARAPLFAGAGIPDRRTWGVLFTEQATRFCTDLAPGWAVSQGIPVGLISALNGLNPLWVWVLALVILREGQSGRSETLFKGIGICGSVLGICLLL